MSYYIRRCECGNSFLTSAPRAFSYTADGRVDAEGTGSKYDGRYILAYCRSCGIVINQIFNGNHKKCPACHTELILDPQPEVEPICLNCGQGYLVLEG